MNDAKFSRLVVGGGIFGCYSAISLARKGHSVLLIEQDSSLLSRASRLNQARLHTGFHYPRSLTTALESRRHYDRFRTAYPNAVRDFHHVYAIAKHNSMTSPAAFARLAERFGAPLTPVDPAKWFHRGSVSAAYLVEEPSFDVAVLRKYLLDEIQQTPEIRLETGLPVIGGTDRGDSVLVRFASGSVIEVERVVLATYAGLNAMRQGFGLTELPLSFELTEIILGTAVQPLENMGLTIMDGPFLSMMPFGKTPFSSLSNVALTPVLTNDHEARFSCQELRQSCTPLTLADCSSCPVRPKSLMEHQVQQFERFVKASHAFRSTSSMLTVKAVLANSQTDDARPTIVAQSVDSRISTVFGGKVSTIFELDNSLA